MLVRLRRSAKGDPDRVGGCRKRRWNCTDDWRRSQKICWNAEIGCRKGDELKGSLGTIGHWWGTIFVIPMSRSRYHVKIGENREIE